MNDREYAASGARSLAKKYGLKRVEAVDLVQHPRFDRVIDDHERFRERHGLPAADSPISRGELLRLMKRLA